MSHEHAKTKQEQLWDAEARLEAVSEQLRRQDRLVGAARSALVDELMIVRTFRELLFDSAETELFAIADQALRRARTLVDRFELATAA